MKRRIPILAALLIATTATAQRNLADAQLTLHPVAGNVHLIEGPGGNIGVQAGPDGLLMVDDKFAPLADKIRGALAQLKSGELKFLLNTHYHGDHTGANAAFGPQVPILAHTNVRTRLMNGRRGDPAPAAAWPVVTFDQGLSIHFNGEEVRAVHLPKGHTDGDIAVFFTGSNVYHLGDHFFNGRFPYVDLDAGGTVAGLTANIAGLIEQIPATARIIPGHGDIASLEDLQTYHDMLTQTAGIVRQHIAAGKDLAAIKKAGLPGWEEWGTGYISTERWLETLHRSLRQ